MQRNQNFNISVYAKNMNPGHDGKKGSIQNKTLDIT